MAIGKQGGFRTQRGRVAENSMCKAKRQNFESKTIFSCFFLLRARESSHVLLTLLLEIGFS